MSQVQRWSAWTIIHKLKLTKWQLELIRTFDVWGGFENSRLHSQLLILTLMSYDEEMLVVNRWKHSLSIQQLIQHQVLAVKHSDISAQRFTCLGIGISVEIPSHQVSLKIVTSHVCIIENITRCDIQLDNSFHFISLRYTFPFRSDQKLNCDWLFS